MNRTHLSSAASCIFLLLLLFFVAACTSPEPSPQSVKPTLPPQSPPTSAPVQPTLPPAFTPMPVQPTWAATFTISPVEIAPRYTSSTKLSARWTPATELVDHYEIIATDAIKGTTIVATVESSASETILVGLKSGTSYTVKLHACLDSACAQWLAADTSAIGATAEEYWQIRGTGHSYETADQVVEHGSTLSYALRYGNEAGTDLAGRAALFFNPGGKPDWMGGVRIALNDSTGTDPDSVSRFAVTANGLQHPCTSPGSPSDCPSETVDIIQASQPIPLADQNTVRLFFEATSLNEPNQPTRIYYLDSHDGYTGQDYDSGMDTVCTTTDFAPGNGCALTVAVGLTGDATGGDSGLSQARQFKIGYPTLVSWLWDGGTGTFMVITGADSCGATDNGLFYAIWDGNRWNTVKEGGCASPLVAKAHGPVVVHLGGDSYKLYYEDESAGKTGKPLHLIYADGGADAVVDFDDWESASSAREVNFLWPDGTRLSAEEESGLGDHMVFLPAGNTETQVMYLNLGGFDNAEWKKPSFGLGMAVLVNP